MAKRWPSSGQAPHILGQAPSALSTKPYVLLRRSSQELSPSLPLHPRGRRRRRHCGWQRLRLHRPRARRGSPASGFPRRVRLWPPIVSRVTQPSAWPSAGQAVAKRPTFWAKRRRRGRPNHTSYCAGAHRNCPRVFPCAAGAGGAGGAGGTAVGSGSGCIVRGLVAVHRPQGSQGGCGSGPRLLAESHSQAHGQALAKQWPSATHFGPSAFGAVDQTIRLIAQELTGTVPEPSLYTINTRIHC